MFLVLFGIAKCIIDFAEPADLLADSLGEEHNIKSLTRMSGLRKDAAADSPELLVPEMVVGNPLEDVPQESPKRGYPYPKMAYTYSIDIQTKVILLGIMLLLLALVASTTTKMVQEVIKIRMKLSSADTAHESGNKV